MADMASRLFYSAVKNLFKLFFTLYNRLEVMGFDNIPHGVPFIVASNHASYIDPPLIGGVLPVRLRYLAKESLFRVPLIGFFVKALGSIPVKREDGQKAGAVMKGMLTLLGNGDSILLFPEGSRSPDGRIKPLEAGVAFLSVKAGVPVLPVYIAGSFKALPRGRCALRPSKLRLSISPPIYPDSGIANERERRDALLKSLETTLLSMEAAADVH
jgi:1-acyl-sn-glycerol-3-phosphate acyltransferase